MCTLSFIPKSHGYLVAMNRDELHSRTPAQAPRERRTGKLTVVYPSDGDDGTWIAVNEAGVTLALMNWSTPPQATKSRSRGEVIPWVAGESSSKAVRRRLSQLELAGMRPFRLFGIFPHDRAVLEWRWSGESVTAFSQSWEPHHWFSSGLSDERAAERRGPQFQQAWIATDAGNIGWLRTLHSSHVPEKGAFSVCVHREDAATVSYTEVEVGSSEVVLRYRNSAPCMSDSFDSEISIPRSESIPAQRAVRL